MYQTGFTCVLNWLVFVFVLRDFFKIAGSNSQGVSLIIKLLYKLLISFSQVPLKDHRTVLIKNFPRFWPIFSLDELSIWDNQSAIQSHRLSHTRNTAGGITGGFRSWNFNRINPCEVINQSSFRSWIIDDPTCQICAWLSKTSPAVLSVVWSSLKMSKWYLKNH